MQAGLAKAVLGAFPGSSWTLALFTQIRQSLCPYGIPDPALAEGPVPEPPNFFTGVFWLVSAAFCGGDAGPFGNCSGKYGCLAGVVGLIGAILGMLATGFMLFCFLPVLAFRCFKSRLRRGRLPLRFQRSAGQRKLFGSERGLGLLVRWACQPGQRRGLPGELRHDPVVSRPAVACRGRRPGAGAARRAAGTLARAAPARRAVGQLLARWGAAIG
ncbi:unnamed protein product [Prorocentrum cordatum]|uniref:Uncharacterized protein n=1 Tax=Prorocentrum cordatum TaxID=2364126 RepID=A0ABN9R1V1_9DINO|nr:unnamed protein product [Polarella glacialis]